MLLAGDAAHRFPPAGAFGMNTGIQVTLSDSGHLHIPILSKHVAISLWHANNQLSWFCASAPYAIYITICSSLGTPLLFELSTCVLFLVLWHKVLACLMLRKSKSACFEPSTPGQNWAFCLLSHLAFRIVNQSCIFAVAHQNSCHLSLCASDKVQHSQVLATHSICKTAQQSVR